jgi:hypothetical protein
MNSENKSYDALSKMIRQLPEFKNLLDENIELKCEVRQLKQQLEFIKSLREPETSVKLTVTEPNVVTSIDPELREAEIYLDTNLADKNQDSGEPVQYLHDKNYKNYGDAKSGSESEEEESGEESEEEEEEVEEKVEEEEEEESGEESEEEEEEVEEKVEEKVEEEEEEESGEESEEVEEEEEEEEEVEEEEVEEEEVEEEEEEVEEVMPKILVKAELIESKNNEEEDEEEDEEEEEVYEVEIEGADETEYYTNDDMNGNIYKIYSDQSIGPKVGEFKEGEPIFY